MEFMHLNRSEVCKIDRDRTDSDSEASLCGRDRRGKSIAYGGIVDVGAVSLYRVASIVNPNCKKPSFVLQNYVEFVHNH
jgi:hypothetical protein